jgi:hypothetical protein
VYTEEEMRSLRCSVGTKGFREVWEAFEDPKQPGRGQVVMLQHSEGPEDGHEDEDMRGEGASEKVSYGTKRGKSQASLHLSFGTPTQDFYPYAK